jgi:tripartite-type tricarboxylate transporter receptor subunit TctC
MRRFTSILGSLLIAGSLAACGGTAASGSAPSATGGVAKPASAAGVAPASAAAKPASSAAAGASTNAAGGVNFQGKTVTIVTGFAAGGPTDLFDRLYARYLPKHLPGSPQAIVQNQTGAGGLVANNNVFASAKPDGLTLLGNTDPATPWILKADGVKYDIGKFVWVGGVSEGSIEYVSAKTGVKAAADLKKPQAPIVLGGLALDSNKDLYVRVFLKAAGIDHKYVTGYAGVAPLNQAIQSGEISLTDASLTDYNTGVLPLIKSNVVVPLTQTGLLGESGQIVPDPRSNLPTMWDAVKTITGQPPSGAQAEAMMFLAAGHNALRALLLPPGTPDNIANTWRKATADVFADPAFKAEAQKQFGIELQYLPGDQAQKIVGATATLAEQHPEGTKLLQDLSKSKDA